MSKAQEQANQQKAEAAIKVRYNINKKLSIATAVFEMTADRENNMITLKEHNKALNLKYELLRKAQEPRWYLPVTRRKRASIVRSAGIVGIDYYETVS